MRIIGWVEMETIGQTVMRCYPMYDMKEWIEKEKVLQWKH